MFAKSSIKTTFITKLLAIFIGFLMVGSGCSEYRVTLNDNDLTHARELYVGYTITDEPLHKCVSDAIEDQVIQQASGLSQLNCSAMGVRSLKGLEVFTALKYLNLKGNTLGSITPLLVLNQLEEVDLSNNPALLCSEVEQLKQRVKRVNAEKCQKS